MPVMPLAASDWSLMFAGGGDSRQLRCQDRGYIFKHAMHYHDVDLMTV